MERRRNGLRTLLQEETKRLEAELEQLVPDRNTLRAQLLRKREEVQAAREERRRKVGSFPLTRQKP